MILNDTYEIKSVIGKGGMSTVYLAEHKRLKTRWAVKEVNKQQGIKFDCLAESNILKKLQHSMLPRIVDIFEDEQYICIVEDYVEGVTLENWLMQNKRVDEEQGLIWFQELCGVLKYLHSQIPNPIIYRDMKPSNIMLQHDGKLKLIDFGIAREYKKDSQGDTTYIGTKGYAAPEQFGKAQTDARTDIYSLGVTMYHLVTGKSPYEPPYQFVPARELNHELSPGLEYILHKCLQLEPEDRYQNVEALLNDLQHIYRYDDAWKKYIYLKRRRKIIVTLMFIISISLMGSGLVIYSQERDAEKAAIAAAYEQKLDSLSDYYTTGRMTEAQEIIIQARQLQPERIESYIQEAYLLYLMGDYQICVTQIESILENAPNNRNALLILASACFELGDYERAAQCFQNADTENQEMDVDNLRDYAVCLGRLGKIEQAEEILEKLIGLGATADVTDYVRGEVAYAQKDYSAAEERFLTALKQTQTTTLYRRSVISLAETYRNSQQYTASIQLLENALTQEELQGNSVLYEMLGAAYYNRGVIERNNDQLDLQRAAECFQQVIILGVQKEYLYVNVFTAYQTIGQYEQAEAILDQMEQIYPQKYTPNALKATLYIIKENQKSQAQRNYTKAYSEYQKAREKVTASDETTYLQQLEGLIEQLKLSGWL